MNISSLASKTKHILSDNSPVLLTAIGVAGVVTTAYLTHKAALQADKIIREESGDNPTNYADGFAGFREKAQLTWKLYIPPISSAAVTCTAIICANRIGTRRAAAVAAAYTISERAFDEYKSKVVEKIGETKERAVRDEIAQDRVTRDLGTHGEILEVDGKVLCHDAYSGRFFYSTVETVNKAVNDLNRDMLENFDGSCSISDFYDKIGLSHTSISDTFGWNAGEPLAIAWSTCATKDGRPAMSYDFQNDPILKPWSKASFR